MGFKDMVAADNHGVFLNQNEFAEKRTIKYDGETYKNIPIVLTGFEERDRQQLQSDHVQGLFRVTSVLHCALVDLDGKQPEKGCKIKINDEEDGCFFHSFYVASSTCEMGMLRVELEAIDE